MPGKYPRTREALEKELEKEQKDAKARVPGMCSFILANTMGCRKWATSPSSQFCARHTVINQMITDGTLSPTDLSFELIAQPL